MNEVVIVIIAIVALIAAVIIYGIISTTMGYEEDVNKNYIPDRLERMLGADPKQKKTKKPNLLCFYFSTIDDSPKRMFG